MTRLGLAVPALAIGMGRQLMVVELQHRPATLAGALGALVGGPDRGPGRRPLLLDGAEAPRSCHTRIPWVLGLRQDDGGISNPSPSALAVPLTVRYVPRYECTWALAPLKEVLWTQGEGVSRYLGFPWGGCFPVSGVSCARVLPGTWGSLGDQV